MVSKIESRSVRPTARVAPSGEKETDRALWSVPEAKLAGPFRIAGVVLAVPSQGGDETTERS